MKEKVIEKEEVFVKSEKERKKYEKSFHITIKDNTTGKVLADNGTDIILGVFRNIEKSNKEGCATQALSVAKCNKLVQIAALEALVGLTKEYKQQVFGSAATPDLLMDLLKMLAEEK